MAIDLSPYAGQFAPEVLSALAELFANKPDREKYFLDNFNGDLKSFLDSEVGWWGENGSKVGDIQPYGPELKLLDALGYQVNPQAVQTGSQLDPNGQPLEQNLLQTALPALTGDIANDANRRTTADALAASALAGTAGATNILQRTQGGHFDSNVYFQQNPDVANAFNGLPAGTAPGTRVYNGQSVTADQFAEQHFLQYGQREGRQPAYIQNAQLAQDFNNADQTVAANVAAANQAAQTNLAALNAAATALQGNLTGDLAARAAALQTQIATLTQNLDQLDATQRKALTDQIAAMQADLEASINTQRQALTDQITALGGAATTEAAAKRDALSAELAGLTAAQAPLAEARNQAAELQATAVNVGLERTRDQLTADAARAGYVGGSTAQDASLARATVDARQRAAEAIAGARTANATDTRDIAVRGATGQRTIADALSAAQRDITGVGATGNAALTGALATGRNKIGDFGSAGTAGITNNTATARAGIGALGANTTFQDQVFGADQKRSLVDALAAGNLAITNNQTNQIQGATDQGIAAKANAYDADYNRSLAAASGLTTIPGSVVNTLTGLDTYANSGLNRSLGTLSWWNTGAGAAPTPGYTPVTPGTTGNDLSALGAGVLRLGSNIGAAQNWWAPQTGVGAPTTYADFLKNNPGSSAATPKPVG